MRIGYEIDEVCSASLFVLLKCGVCFQSMFYSIIYQQKTLKGVQERLDRDSNFAFCMLINRCTVMTKCIVQHFRITIFETSYL